MNFLAHSLFGFDEDALIAGQICGDFVRGSDLSRFPARVETGIRLHRHLDGFIDLHPVLREVRAELQGVPRRFTGILIDVLFDHYLAQHWQRFSHRTLDQHARQVYGALENHRAVLPASLHRFMTVLSGERILQRNVELMAIEQTLTRLSRRSARFAPLALTVEQLHPLAGHLQAPFETIYPELHATAVTWLAAAGQAHQESAT